MGTCCTKEAENDNSGLIEYMKDITLNIVRRNYLGKSIGTSKVTFKNTSPINQQSLHSLLGKKSLKVYGCILPGLDPRGELDKECQDNYAFIQENDSILCALYDGHGKEGLKVSNFCIQYTEKFFKKNIANFVEKPEETLTRLLEKCDLKLEKSKINCGMSGSTAVAVYITEKSIHSASLGDSRAIISTLSEESIPAPEVPHKYHKKIVVKRNLKPVPLTIDQKPNHEEEFARIIASGGNVEQVTDSFGKPIGPFRV